MCPQRATEELAPETDAQWYRRARSACEPFMFAAARFRTPWVDDEFAAVIRTARQWLRDNPCPDDLLGRHFVVMLDAYNEMTNATVARVMELRVTIERQVEALDYWKPPSSRAARSLHVESGIAGIARERQYEGASPHQRSMSYGH